MPNPIKRARLGVLSAVFVFGLHAACLAEPVTLVEQGVSDYRIYSSPSAAAPEVYAAEVL